MRVRSDSSDIRFQEFSVRSVDADGVFFVQSTATKDDPFAMTEDGGLWVGHTAIATGFGQVLHASWWSERVIEENLRAFLIAHREYSGFVAIRLERPRGRR